MSLDYPLHKLSVYLSDDAGSSITLYALKQAFVFAKSWIPFCKKYGLETRCPEAYFSASRNNDLHHGSSTDKLTRDNEIIKVIKGDDNAMNVESDKEESESELPPLLVYVSREKRPSHPHHFKAGALNVLLRVSGIISNAPYVLVLDCDMNCNDPSSARQAMCFHLDPHLNSNSSFAFVQFPQNFHNLSKNDIYNRQIMSIFQFIASLNRKYCKLNVIANGDWDEARFLASCVYEKNTQWGEQIGFMYHSVVEDYFTGFLLHCKGWTSAYYSPSKPSFLGSAPTNLNDTLVQSTRWSSGLLQVAFSRFCPLTYGISRMSILQNMAYASLAFQPLYALPTLCFAIIPQMCLFNGISLYPKVSSPWFYVFLAVYASSLCQNILETLRSGGSLRMWWYEHRMFRIKSVTAFLFGCLDMMMKLLGLKEIEFLPTNKVVDEEQDVRYKMDIFDFQTGTTFLFPLTTLSILNMVSLVVGLRRVIIERCFDEMFGQIFLSFMILMISYPIIEAMIIRKDNGRIRTSVTLLSVSVLMIFFSFKALASVLLFNGGLTSKLHILSWVLIFVSEFLLFFYWLIGQAYRWRPVSRTVYPERLPEDTELPSIDVFRYTADPKKEPTVGVMNTVLLAM
ncbi:Cellulose synthase [Macleaya cordata]|uniref:Cellulose synthase n=1 Tax=Macleaya cordata TaxID=56857 RepID=A0A200PW75_MACCD|nr:Cellulose synthase [Macleaya cordata]